VLGTVLPPPGKSWTHPLRSRPRPKLVWDQALSQPGDLVAQLVLTVETSVLERQLRVGDWETSSGKPRERVHPNQTTARRLPAPGPLWSCRGIRSCSSGCGPSSPPPADAFAMLGRQRRDACPGRLLPLRPSAGQAMHF